MADIIFNSFLDGLLGGKYNLSDNSDPLNPPLDVKCALLIEQTGDPLDNIVAGMTGTEVMAYEIDPAGSVGYTQGGKSLTNKIFTNPSQPDDAGFFSADAVEWPDSTITAGGALLYVEISGAIHPIAFMNFNGNKSSSAGTFTVQWNANGILNMQQASL